MPNETPPLLGADYGLVTFAAVAIAASAAASSIVIARLRRGLPLVPSRPNQPVPWSGGDVLVIALGFGFLANVAGTLLGPDQPLDRTLGAHLIVVALASVFACAWVMARGATFQDLGLAGIRLRDDMALAITGVALVLAPLLSLNAWLTMLRPYEHPVIELLMARRDAWTVGLVLATACISAPVGEELFFRRILQGWLEKAIPSAGGYAAIAIASLAFAAAHAGQGLGYIPLFPLGVVLGILAQRTGSIVPSIILHALFNAVSVGILLATPTRG